MLASLGGAAGVLVGAQPLAILKFALPPTRRVSWRRI